MKVLLWQDVDKLGKRGEVIEVRKGYARNYLIPRRLASVPTPSMYKEFELEKRRQSKMEAALVSDAKKVAERLTEVTSVSIEVSTNEQGHLYGSITPTMIADALLDKGIKVEPRVVEIAQPIKEVGTYEVAINLHRDVRPTVKIWVLTNKAVKPEGEPAAEKPAEPRKGDAPAQA